MQLGSDRSGAANPPERRLPNARDKRQSLWAIVAFFFESAQSHWLDDLIEDESLVFRKVPPLRSSTSWHSKRSIWGGLKVWAGHLGQAARAVALRPDGIITAFPQLAMCTGILKRLGPVRPKIIAYNFNLGSLSSGIRRSVARFIAPAIDAFVVHSPSEITPYARYLEIPEDRFTFVPLQRGVPGTIRRENTEAPFVLAMGSAGRDYTTLIKAVDRLAVPTIIVTRADAATTLPSSPHITLKSDLSPDECIDLLARARLSVTPVGNLATASGQITFINAMRLGVPVIATRCPGTEGYIEDGQTGCLVPPFDDDALATAIEILWHDSEERGRMAERAQEMAERRFSDAAAATALHELVRKVQERDRHA